LKIKKKPAANRRGPKTWMGTPKGEKAVRKAFPFASDKDTRVLPTWITLE
jgi:hypothetical protein